jgi:hypothetical protein
MERKELNRVVEVGVRWGEIVDQNVNSNIIDHLICMSLFVRLNILNIFVLLFLTYLFNLGNDKNKNR